MTVVSLKDRIPKRLSLAGDVLKKSFVVRRLAGRLDDPESSSGVRSCESPGDLRTLDAPSPLDGSRATASLCRSAPRRGSRDPSVGSWLGGPENPPNGPGASGGPKCSYFDMGHERKSTRFRPPPNFRILAPPSRHLPARPSRRRNRDYAMNFQWIFTMLLFALVAPCAFTSIYTPRCAGVRWLHVVAFLV